MRIFCLLVALVLATMLGDRARADDTPSPEALQAANQLFTIVSGDMLKQLTGQITGAFWPAVEQSARAEKIDDATIAELRKEFDRVELAFVTDALKAGARDLRATFQRCRAQRIVSVLSNADRRQSAARDAAGDGGIHRYACATPAGGAAASVGGIRQDPARARLQEVTCGSCATPAPSKQIIRAR